MYRYLSIFCTLYLLSITHGTAQTITLNPLMPTDNDALTITFDTTQGNAGLAGYTGDIYAHTGVITNTSNTSSDWQYVKTNWGENTPATRLENIGNDLYQLTISPSIRTYYGVPEGETILQLAFVFRSAEPSSGGTYLEGKTNTGGNILCTIYPDGLTVVLTEPSSDPLILGLNDSLTITATANFANELRLYLNNELIDSSNDVLLNKSILANTYGSFWLKAVAENDTAMVSDSSYFFVRPPITTAPLPYGIKTGITYTSDTSATLVLFAPWKEHVFILGDFNNWTANGNSYMKRSPEGFYYWIQLNNLVPQQEYAYQFLIDGYLKVGDPYAEKISDPYNDSSISETTYPDLINYPYNKTNGIVSLLQTAQTPYNWQVNDFVAPEKQDLIIYELLVRDFTNQRNYKALIDTLDYLEQLGINAIELMPVAEFEGNDSWGYNPSYFFAPDKFYGTKNDLKQFIDACHARGIAVILDIVLNHAFGESPMVRMYWNDANNQIAFDSPWFNQTPKHDYNVGFDFNHESMATQRFTYDVVKHWLSEYHIDGYRFDLSKGFTQTNTLGNSNAWANYDSSRVAIWQAIADTVRSVNNHAYIILEHFANDDEEQVLSSYGMMLWGNMMHPYSEAAMAYNAGNNSDLSRIYHGTRGFTNPHLIGYMESHDEERLMVKNLLYGNSSSSGYSTQDSSTALNRMELAAAFFLTIPGPKMIWQFGELGYDYPIDYNGRTGMKPIRWDYLSELPRKHLYEVYRALLHLRRNHAETFRSSDITLALSGDHKRIHINDNSMNFLVVGNFGVEGNFIDPHFQHTGIWYDYFSGETLTVSDTHTPLFLSAGAYRIYTSTPLATPDIALGSSSTTDNIGKATNTLGAIIYPNPSQGNFCIRFNTQSLQPTPVNMVLYDTLGKQQYPLIQNEYLQGKQERHYPLDFSGKPLIAGVYFYRLQIGEQYQVGKFIVVR